MSSDTVVLEVNGNIGVGKTSLCDRFLRIEPDHVQVLKEDPNPIYLEDSYSSKPIPGANDVMQNSMLAKCKFALKMAFIESFNDKSSKEGEMEEELVSGLDKLSLMHLSDTLYNASPKKEQIAVTKLLLRTRQEPTALKRLVNVKAIDRGLPGNFCFALVKHFRGEMTKRSLMGYAYEFGFDLDEPSKMFEQWPEMGDVTQVLLVDFPENCMKRVDETRELKYRPPGLEYYKQLDNAHYHVFINTILRNKLCPLRVFFFSDYDHQENIEEDFNGKRIFDSLTARDWSCKMQWNVRLPNSSVELGKAIVYTPEKVSIMKNTLKSLKEGKVSGDMVRMSLYPLGTPVYIPEWIGEAKVELEAQKLRDPNGYYINVYEDWYRITILWHLSKGHEVLLYSSK